MAATIGRIGEFLEGKEDIECYLERMSLFFTANNVSDIRAVSVFLTVVGPAAYALLKSLCSPQKPSDKTIEQLTVLLQNHYSPKPLTIAERYKFHKRDQREGESTPTYLVEVKKLASTCEFGTFLEEAIRDRIVCGLRDQQTIRRLLTISELTLAKAIEVATSMELATQQAMEFQAPTTARFQVQSPVHKIHSAGGSYGKHRAKNSYRESGPSKGQGLTCYRCLDPSHSADSCPFKEQSCFYCKKVGHIAKACRKKAKQRDRRTSNYPVKAIAEETDDSGPSSDNHMEIYTIKRTTGSKNDGVFVEINVAGKPIHMEVDTGAAVSIISEDWYIRNCQLPLETTAVKLKTYNGESIPILGKLVAPVTYQSGQFNLPAYVVKGNSPSLLGREWLRHIKLDWQNIFGVTTDESVPSVQDLTDQYPTVFAVEGGPIAGFKADVQVSEGAHPKYFKSRPVPYSLKPKVESELRRLESEGIITKVERSDWATPIVIVPKANDSIRLCGDYKVTVNRDIDNANCTLPTADDLFASLVGGKVFTKLDLTQAYQQLELEDMSKKLLTINSHLGLFQFNRLPFGVSTAPGIFQGIMDQVLQGIEGVVCYLDDILISSPSMTHHKQAIHQVLNRLEKYHIRVKPAKCEWFQTSVEYLGHKVDAEGLHPTAQKLEAIENAPSPTNVTELKSYLGLLNYYGKFMPNLSTLLHPMNNLLGKDVSWKWDEACESAFIQSKEKLLQSQILAHYDVTKPLKLACDASAYGIGAVISHIMPNGEERPIAFASRTLSSSEKNYAQIEREALSLIFGVRKFHKYLYGRKFTLITDHKPLTTILNPKSSIPTLAAARMQRWALILSAYTYDIEYRRSTDHGNADAMSRLPCGKGQDTSQEESIYYFSYVNDLPVTSNDIKDATRKDPVLSKVYDYVAVGWPSHVDEDEIKPYFYRRNELSVDSGCLLWGLRVIIPPVWRQQLLKDLHTQHLGMCSMKGIARSYFWWPSLDSAIERVVKTCSTCLAVSKGPPVAPLQAWEWPTRVWQRLHIDYAELDGQHLFILVDSHSKWVEAVPMNQTTATKTIEILRNLFAAYGLPEEIVSDNGPQFTSEEFRNFMLSNGITHTRVPPYHPASNGAAERTVQTVKRALIKYKLDPSKSGMTIRHKLANFLFGYRNTPHTTTGRTPADLFLKRQPRNRLSLLKTTPQHICEGETRQTKVVSR